MKFVVTWSIGQDKWLPVLETWGSMTYIGRWNANMDEDIAPVLDDEESAAVARALTGKGSD